MPKHLVPRPTLRTASEDSAGLTSRGQTREAQRGNRYRAAHADEPLDALIYLLRSHRLPIPQRDYRFHPTMRWRFDLAWPEHQLALDVIPVDRDLDRDERFERYNTALAMGWRVIRCSEKHCRSGHGVRLVERMLKDLKENA